MTELEPGDDPLEQLKALKKPASDASDDPLEQLKAMRAATIRPHVPGVAAETTAAKPKAGPAPEAPTRTSVPEAAAFGYVSSIPGWDRIAALTSAAMTGSSYGGRFGANYDKALGQVRDVNDAANREHGTASKVGGAAGLVQQAMLAPTSAVTAGKSMLPSLLKQGAAFGAMQGASNTRDLSDVPALATNVGMGTVLGAGAGAAGAGVGKLATGVATRVARTAPIRALLARAGTTIDDNVTAAAKAKVTQALERDMMTGDDLLTRGAEAVGTGKPVVLADLGEGNVKGLTQAVGTVPGKAQRRLRETLEGRIGDKTMLEQGPQTQRVRGDLQQAFNAQPEDLHALAQQLTEARDVASNVNYGRVRQDVTPLHLPELDAAFNDPQYGHIFREAHNRGIQLSRAMGETVPMGLPPGAEMGPATQMLERARDLMSREPWRKIDLTPLEQAAASEGSASVPQATIGTLDLMKRGIDPAIEIAQKRGGLSSLEGSILKQRLDNILAAADAVHPDYAAARAAHATASGEIDALNAGRGIADNARRRFAPFGGAAPEVTAADVATMTPAQRALYQRGAHGALDAKIATRADNLDPVTPIAGQETQRAQIRAALQDRPDAADALIRGLEWERRIRATRDATFGGSNTMNKAAAVSDLGVGPQDVAQAGAAAARGRPVQAIYDLFLRHGAQRLGTSFSEPTNDAIAQLLLARPDASMLSDLARTAARRAATRKTFPALARIFGAEAGSLASQP